MKTALKTRLIYAAAAIAIVAAGLLSRRLAFVPNCVGDALWAMAVYCGWRIILPRRSRLLSFAAALITSYAVEFSQLLHPDWLDKLRSTFIGHMLLGQGFLLSDIAAYTVGAALIFAVSELLGRMVFRTAEPESRS